MHGIGTNVATATLDFDLNDYQIVDMFKIFADSVFGEPGVTATNDKIPSRTEANLAGNVARQDELAIVPTYINLLVVRKGREDDSTSLSFAYPLLFDVQIMSANMVKEGASVSCLKE